MCNYNNSKNEEFFTTLYLEHFDYVYKTIKYVTNDTCSFAEDIAQETMIRLFGYIDTLQLLDKRALKQYIKKSAVNTAINHKKRQSEYVNTNCIHTAEPGIFSLDSYNAQKATENIIEDNLNNEHLLKQINSLSERDRTLILLRYFGGLSDKEISDRTGINKDYIRVYISRAIAKLSKKMSVQQQSQYFNSDELQ